MGKVANITIEYYDDNFDIEKIYEVFLSQDAIRLFDTNYFLVDYEPVKFELNSSKNIKDIILEAIRIYKSNPLGFSVIFSEIITHHTLNANKNGEINIAISSPLLLKESNIPDFSFYSERILPYFSLYEIQKVQFSYG